MKIPCLIISSLLASALAAPAVVWKKSGRSEQRFLHTADELSASDLLKNVLDVDEGSSLPSVVFLVGKGQDGSESLSELASSGKLPSTAAKYSDADGIFHHVSGIESTATMAREASRANSGVRALQVTLSELNSKLTSHESVDAEVEVVENGLMSKSAKHATKRARELASANVFIVQVNPNDDASKIDTTIASTIENAKVGNVVLAGIRSTNEVKHERYMASRRRMNVMEAEGQRVLESRRRRRLEEEQGDQGDDANNGNDSDMSGVYYVAMTPNIFAGLLFGLLFIVIAWIGITCMGGIAGQDTYVTKMPTIGREA